MDGMYNVNEICSIADTNYQRRKLAEYKEKLRKEEEAREFKVVLEQTINDRKGGK